MNPGTERAIQLLSESLPSQLRALTKAITTLSETTTEKGSLVAYESDNAGVKPVVLHLTQDEWTELTSAISSFDSLDILAQSTVNFALSGRPD